MLHEVYNENEEFFFVNVTSWNVFEEYEWINCLCKCYMDESEQKVYVNVTRWSIRRVWVNKLFM
jgi:hypothetical protein